MDNFLFLQWDRLWSTENTEIRKLYYLSDKAIRHRSIIKTITLRVGYLIYFEIFMSEDKKHLGYSPSKHAEQCLQFSKKRPKNTLLTKKSFCEWYISQLSPCPFCFQSGTLQDLIYR